MHPVLHAQEHDPRPERTEALEEAPLELRLLRGAREHRARELPRVPDQDAPLGAEEEGHQSLRLRRLRRLVDEDGVEPVRELAPEHVPGAARQRREHDLRLVHERSLEDDAVATREGSLTSRRSDSLARRRSRLGVAAFAHAAGYLLLLARVRQEVREPRHVRDGLVPVLVQAAHLPHARVVLLSEPNQLARLERVAGVPRPPRLLDAGVAVRPLVRPDARRRLALERVVFPVLAVPLPLPPRDQILDERRRAHRRDALGDHRVGRPHANHGRAVRARAVKLREPADEDALEQVIHRRVRARAD